MDYPGEPLFPAEYRVHPHLRIICKRNCSIFDRMRHKRHSPVYDAVGVISAVEAEFAVSAAEALVQKVAMLLG